MAVSNLSKALEIMGSRTLFEWILMKSLDLLNSKKSWFSQGIPSQNFVWVVKFPLRLSKATAFCCPWSGNIGTTGGQLWWKEEKESFPESVWTFFSSFWIPKIDVFNLSCVVLTYYYRYTCCNLQFGSMARTAVIWRRDLSEFHILIVKGTWKSARRRQ